MTRTWSIAAAGFIALCCTTGAFAQPTDSGDDAAEPAPPAMKGEFKLTLGHYLVHGDGGADGDDLNLRYRRGDTTLWGGVYRDDVFGRQARAGVDTRWKPLEGLDFAVMPALMTASRGFVGGSLVLEAGAPFYVQLGLGRTNLKPFVNLNFDPNDAITVAVGWRDDKLGSYALTVIRDDRLGTGQQHIHATAQWPLGHGNRLTVDALHKSGMGSNGAQIRGNGLTVTYDWPGYFARFAYDPKQNFDDANVTRLSIGMRF